MFQKSILISCLIILFSNCSTFKKINDERIQLVWAEATLEAIECLPEKKEIKNAFSNTTKNYPKSKKGIIVYKAMTNLTSYQIEICRLFSDQVISYMKTRYYSGQNKNINICAKTAMAITHILATRKNLAHSSEVLKSLETYGSTCYGKIRLIEDNGIFKFMVNGTYIGIKISNKNIKDFTGNHGSYYTFSQDDSEKLLSIIYRKYTDNIEFFLGDYRTALPLQIKSNKLEDWTDLTQKVYNFYPKYFKGK